MSENRRPPRRRSCLSVPGSSERMLAKAAACQADEVVIDLEDAVIPGDKASALETVRATLERWPDRTVAVRVNAPRTPWCHHELAALAQLPRLPHSIVLPKVESAADVQFAERLLDGAEAGAERPAPLAIQALVETAVGLTRVDEIAGSSPRLETLILGYGDLEASLGGRRDRDAWLPTQHAVLLAARAHGLQAIDGPYLGVTVDPAFEADTERVSELGFDGKWAIHPAQLDTLNTEFTPTGPEIEHAHAVIAALAAADRGAVALDGEMLDEAVRQRALRLLARAGESAPDS